MTAEAGPILSAAPVTDLVMRARDGDQPAWGAIVERFAPAGVVDLPPVPAG